MAEGVTFYKGAEKPGKGPGSTTPEQPKKGDGPVQFYKGADDVSAIKVPSDGGENVEGGAGKGSPVTGPMDK